MTGITIQKRPLPASESNSSASLRTFYKRTARGKVQKILRERYLRDDVFCGRRGCELCEKANVDTSLLDNRTFESGSGLQEKGRRSQDRTLGAHILILDTNVVLHQMDLLESTLGENSTATITNVILLQTVLDETRHRSLPLYNRLMSLLRDPERHWWIYWNDYSA